MLNHSPAHLLDLAHAVVFDLKGEIIFWTKGTEQMYGWTAAETLGRNAHDLLQTQFAEPLEEIKAKLLSDGEWQGELVHTRRDGSPITVASHWVLHRDEHGKPSAILELNNDITEQKRTQEVLRESRAQLENLIGSAMDAIITVAEDQRIVLFNAAAEKMFRCPADEALGQPINRFIPQRFRATHREHIHAFSETNVTSRSMGSLGSISGLRADGEEFQIEASISQAEVAGGKLFTVILRDISERRRAEEIFRLAVEAAPNAMVMVDGQGKIALINSQAETMFGYARAELIGQPVEMLVPDRFRARHPGYRAGFFAAPDARPMGGGRDLYGKRKDGREIPVEIGLNPLATAEGTFVLASIIDITERKRAEERFRLAVESAPNAMVMVDEAGKIVLINSQAERLFGYSRDDLIGQSVEILVPERFRAEHVGYRAGFYAVPQARAMGAGRDLYGLRKDGTEIPIEIGLNPIRTEKGRLVLSSIVDITGRKRAEAERERLLALEQQARRGAEEANRLKDEFLATVSHELRTPLTSILGYSKMLCTGRLGDKEMARALEAIERNARSQARIVNDILEVSRIITGKLRLDARPVSPVSAVEAAIEAIRPAVEAKGIRLITALDLSIGPVMGDPDRLQQIAWNLLSNAVKFTPQGGRVEIRLEELDGHVQLKVSDTGIGIAPEFLPFVFDRFRQADSSITRSHGGLGLGLSVVRHLVELHGGTAEAASAGAGQGATFTVTLPLTAAGGVTDDSGRGVTRDFTGSLEEQTPDTCPALQDSRVLVVDDEEDTREMLKMVFERCGAEVRTAASAREAFEIFEQWRPGVMICDIGMPGEDGYSFIRRVRAAEAGRAQQTPALALTGYARSEDRARALSAGYQMHVAKPIDPLKLTAAVATLSKNINTD